MSVPLGAPHAIAPGMLTGGEPYPKLTYQPPAYTWQDKVLTSTWIDRLANKISYKAQYLYDPAITQTVQDLVDNIARANGISRRYQILVVNDDSYNAEASLEGLLLVNKGFLQKAQTPEELAFVLAHELSHDICQDVRKNTLSNLLLVTPPLAVLGGILGWQVSGKLFESFKKNKNKHILPGMGICLGLGVIGYKLSMLSVKRREKEADLRALVMLHNAGIPISSFDTFIDNVIQTENTNHTGIKKLLNFLFRDHPAPLKRKALLEELQQQLPPMVPTGSNGFGLTPMQWQMLKWRSNQL